MTKRHDLVSVMMNSDSFLRCLPRRFCGNSFFSGGQLTDVQSKKAACMANAHDKFLASLYGRNGVIYIESKRATFKISSS